MIRKLALPVLLTVCSFAFNNTSVATTYVNNGGSTNYNLTSADSLYVASGTYTGSITGFASGAKITISYTATFTPASMPNNANGTIYNYGIFSYTSAWTVNTDFTVNNYAGGVMTFGAITIKGKNQVWTNNVGGTINFSGNVIMNGALGDDNNVMINHEAINASGNFQMNSGSFLTNYKDFNVSGDFKANGGILENQGNFAVTGLIDLNSGASSITNYCRMQASGGISISNGNFINYSYLWTVNSDITISSGLLQNVMIFGTTVPIVHGRNYTETGGSVIGPGRFYFYGTTKISSGTIGVTGVTTDTIRMNDITRTSPTTIFDNQAAGTVRPNVIYDAWGIPDSTRIYLFGCSAEVALTIPLAINWTAFDVVVSAGNIPLLTWSAQFDKQTIFEIERSYDGRNFSKIDQVAAVERQSDYTYNDRSVSDHVIIAYYRIKAAELGGEMKYTQVKMVRFSSTAPIIKTAPNPYKSNFIISYQAVAADNITVRILNVSGQQKIIKNLQVNKGSNNINIVEASTLPAGLYIVQVSNGPSIIFSNKIIKQ